MKHFNSHISWIFIVLYWTAILYMGSIGRARAGTVHVDSIRAKVINELNTAADKNGLDIEVAVPFASHVFLKGVEKPVMNLTVPSEELYRSRVPVKVEFIGDMGEVVRRITVIAQVRSFATVAVTAVDIERGAALSSGDVVMKKTEVTGIRDYFVSPVKCEGMQAKRRLKEGTVLKKSAIETVPLVSRGEKVIVKVCIGNITVRSDGTAREDGGLNETIRVYSEATKKTIYGKVIDKRTVLIGGEGG